MGCTADTSSSPVTRIAFFGTSHRSSNGYSMVSVGIVKSLAQVLHTSVSHFAFQSNSDLQNHRLDYPPPNVTVFDAHQAEKDSGHVDGGFGLRFVVPFLEKTMPDVIILYNDSIIVSHILDQLKTKAAAFKHIKKIVYIDQVYPGQKREYVKRLNEEVDMVLAFTPYWMDCIKSQGLTIPVDFLPHGFDPSVHFPIPRHVARKYFNLNTDDFVVLNMNRNNQRKHIAVTMMAWALFVSRHRGEPVRLLLATAMTGACDVWDVYERELRKYGIGLEEGRKHVLSVAHPQSHRDEEINVMYSLSDVGINTCDGEGWGLTNFQQAAIGVPQIVPALGGFLDFLTPENSIMIEPTATYYIDGSLGGIGGGEAQVCNARDFTDAIEMYYADEKLRVKHGKTARADIMGKYAWASIGVKLHAICRTLCGHDEAACVMTLEEVHALEPLEPLEALEPSEPLEALQVIKFDMVDVAPIPIDIIEEAQPPVITTPDEQVAVMQVLQPPVTTEALPQPVVAAQRVPKGSKHSMLSTWELRAMRRKLDRIMHMHT